MTENHHSEWTLNTLKEHLTAIIEANDKRYVQDSVNQNRAVQDALAAQKELTSAAFASSEKAIVKAEEAQRDYNVRSNEFRGQLDDQAQTLMPRTETTVLIKSTEDKLYVSSKTSADKMEELAKKVESLSIRQTTIEGRGSGANSMWGYILGVFMAIVAVVALFKGFK